MDKYTMPRQARTGQLYATPRFILGMGSLFNIFGFYFRYNRSETAQKADTAAIRNDWAVIGQDLQKAIDTFPGK